MSRTDVTLIGLLEDTILPGEERSFDRTRMVGMADSKPPKSICAVAITTAVEIPSMVASRWATECTLVAQNDAAVTLRGARRVRIVATRSSGNAHSATITSGEDEGAPPREQLTDMRLRAIRASADALSEGRKIVRAEAFAELDAAVRALLRATSSSEQIREGADKPIDEALLAAASDLAHRARVEEASAVLESAVRATVASDASVTLSRPLQQRLWSQVIEIQRRLDVYDPEHKVEEHDTLARLQKRLMQAGLPRDAREVAKRELRLLRSMKTDHHEFSTYSAHLDLMARLPWHPDALPPPDLSDVAKALDRSHTGLEKAKRRILEFLAVHNAGGQAGTVLCLAGPPGVGKTTIVRAIASALGRKFVRVPLGGVHDESEIRGHRISYTAALPGRIIAGIARVGSASAVVLLDELDKLGTDRSRSPFGALLEVLDPEQNREFMDNYLAVPFDLSNVLFVATANDLDEIHPTLRDRLEVLELEGYTQGEKKAIARTQLLPALAKEHALAREIRIDDATLDRIIENYTREAGVRELRRELAAIHRNRTLKIALHESGFDPAGSPDEEEVRAVLGAPKYRSRVLPNVLPIGTSIGLSVSGVGGAALFVEARRSKGETGVSVTGRAGEVLRESARAALSLLRSEPARFGLTDAQVAEGWHIHLPDGATPKDGPSAGLAMLIAMISAASGNRARADVTMTGEVTLAGEILPVGGIRAKVLAAVRAGAACVLIPDDNAHDVPADPGIEIVRIKEAHEALPRVFATDSPVEHVPTRRSATADSIDRASARRRRT